MVHHHASLPPPAQSSSERRAAMGIDGLKDVSRPDLPRGRVLECVKCVECVECAEGNECVCVRVSRRGVGVVGAWLLDS